MNSTAIPGIGGRTYRAEELKPPNVLEPGNKLYNVQRCSTSWELEARHVVVISHTMGILSRFALGLQLKLSSS